MDHSWVQTSPPKKKKPSKQTLMKERLEEQKESIAEQHKQLKRDFLRRQKERAA